MLNIHQAGGLKTKTQHTTQNATATATTTAA